jgi:tetratricopeptide (TPR) repeat protein
MIGESYRNLNLYENAITYYKKLIVTYPGFEQLDRAHFTLADSYFKLSRYGQALREYTRLIARFPRSPFKADAYLQIAVCFENLNRYEYALQAYAKFLKLFPADPHSDEVRFSIGTVHYKNRQYQKAIDAFKETVGVYPYDKFNARAYYMIAESLARLDDFEQARKWMFELVYAYMQHPLAKDALFKIGDYFLAQQNVEKAREFYEKALEKDAASPLARDKTIALADIYFAQKNYGQAIDLYERALKKFPNAAGNDQVLMQTGRAHALKGNHIQAAHAFDQLVRDYPASGLIEEALYSKADGLFSLEMFKEAQQTYIKLFSLFPRTQRKDLLFYRLALCSFNLGAYEETVNYVRDGFRKSAYTVYAYRAEFLQARAHIKQGALNEALGMLERMSRGGQVKDKEVYYQICFTYARLAAELQLADKAVKVLNRLMRSWHGNYHFTEALALKVELLENDKKFRQAVEAYRSAIDAIGMQVVLSERDRIKQQVELADSLTGLGDLLFKQKDFRMALVHYTRAWKLTTAADRKSWLLFQIANCHASLHQSQLAQQFFVRLKTDYPGSFWAGKADWYIKNADWKQVVQP